MQLSDKERKLIELVRRIEPEGRSLDNLICFAETQVEAMEFLKSSGFNNLEDAAAALFRDTRDLTDHAVVLSNQR